MKRMIGIICAVLGITTGLVGCGGAPGHSGNTPASSSAPNSSEARAPKVPHPVDVDQYRLDPCALVPETTLQTLKLGQPKTDTADHAGDKPAKSCDWHRSGPPGVSERLHVWLIGTGLDEQYEKQQTLQEYDYFKPDNINGYPAVYDVAIGEQKNGDNGMMLGVNEHESIGISTHSDYDPERAKKIVDRAGAAIVRNIQSKGQ